MRPVHLLQLTDPHLYADEAGEIHGINSARSLRRVLDEAVDRGSPRPDAIVVTGDIADDLSAGAYLRLRAALEPCRLPVYCVPGNHDDPALMGELLGTDSFQFCGRGEVGAWGLVMASTHSPDEVGGRISAAEFARLEADLAVFCDGPVVVCMHHPAVPVGSPWIDALGLQDADMFLALVARHPQVKAVLAGHVHQSFETVRGTTRYMTSPSTCAQFKPRTLDSEIDRLGPGYRLLELRADGSFVSTARWLSA